MIAHGLAPEGFTIDVVTLGLLGLMVVVVLVPLLESADLPGGGGIKFREDLRHLQEEVERAQDAQLGDSPVTAEPPSESSATAASVGDSGSVPLPRDPSIDDTIDRVLAEAARSPQIGLIQVAVELERAVRRLVFSMGPARVGERRPLSVREGVARLTELGALSEGAASALTLFSSVRNRIVHGYEDVSEGDVLVALDAGVSLLTVVLNAPHERHFVRRVDVELFEDDLGSQQRVDVRGIAISSVRPGGSEYTRVFPTTHTNLTPGQEVSWEWGKRSWERTWYRDSDTGAMRLAWDMSNEFLGRDLRTV